MELFSLTAHEARALVRERQVSCRELTEAVLARVQEVEDRVRAYVTVTGELALRQADGLDARLAAGEDPGPLTGIPVALKDVLCTAGVRTTCSSKILGEFRPPYSATVVERLTDAGAVCVGKTNLDEFAMGSSTENSGFFTTHNPWNLDTVPGGSSGGSTAAVAADECLLAVGSDTGGSIRQPAALCGVVGMKPTYGRVSRYGLIAFASSLDQIGPITKDVTDCALLTDVISGHDPRDSTSLRVPVPSHTEALRTDVNGLRLGLPRELFAQGVAPEVADAVHAAVKVLTDAGAVCEEVSLPHAEHALAVYYIIAPAEASSNLARYDGVQYGHRSEVEDDIVSMLRATRREGFGHEVKHRIMIGTYALSSGYYDAYYGKAQRVRTLIKGDFDAAFEQFDVLVSPTSPTVAFGIGEKAGDPLAMKLSDVCTIPANIAGVPGISIPCGFHDGLPIGLQFIGKPLDEPTLIRVAYTYEQATEWHRRRAAL